MEKYFHLIGSMRLASKHIFRKNTILRKKKNYKKKVLCIKRAISDFIRPLKFIGNFHIWTHFCLPTFFFCSDSLLQDGHGCIHLLCSLYSFTSRIIIAISVVLFVNFGFFKFDRLLKQLKNSVHLYVNREIWT